MSSRLYTQTHPWITFGIDLHRFDHRLWLALGEAISKVEHIAGTPLNPTMATKLHRLYLARGVGATTAIEGNTLTEEQVAQQLDGTLELPPSQRYLAQELDNILAACNYIADDVLLHRQGRLDFEVIGNYNRLVLKDLELAEEVIPGKIRAHDVGVLTYRAAPWQDCGFLLGRLCDWLNGADFGRSAELPEMLLAIVKAIVAHIYIAWIHPFGDGNGRTARLVELQILLWSGFPSPAAHLLSNHYNQTRSEYYRILSVISRNGGDVTPFVAYAVQGLVDGLRAQIEKIRSYQMDVVWENHVHALFRGQPGKSAERRKWLLLDLSQHPRPISRTMLPLLSPRLATAYRGKTERTLSRDINELVAADLLLVTEEGCSAHKDIVKAFLPARVEGESVRTKGTRRAR